MLRRKKRHQKTTSAFGCQHAMHLHTISHSYVDAQLKLDCLEDMFSCNHPSTCDGKKRHQKTTSALGCYDGKNDIKRQRPLSDATYILHAWHIAYRSIAWIESIIVMQRSSSYNPVQTSISMHAYSSESSRILTTSFFSVTLSYVDSVVLCAALDPHGSSSSSSSSSSNSSSSSGKVVVAVVVVVVVAVTVVVPVVLV